jgi:predicted nucleotidyltransferase
MRIAEALEMSPEELAGGPARSSSAPELAKVIAVIRSIRDTLEREGVEHLDIFGSVARGDASPDSDVDVIVTPRRDARFSLFNLSAVGSSLEDALARNVDIVTPYTVKNSKRLQGALEYAVRAF